MKVFNVMKICLFRNKKHFLYSEVNALFLCKSSANTDVFTKKTTEMTPNRYLSCSVKNEALVKDVNSKGFKLLFTIQKVDYNFVTFFKILCRYQMLLTCGSLPFAYSAYVDGLLSSLVAATYLGLCGAVLAVSSYFLYSRRNYVCSLWINEQSTHIRVRYLTHFAKLVERTFLVKYLATSLIEPEFEFGSKFAKLVFASENVDYLLSLKDGVIPHEKDFLEVFGPTTLSVFKEHLRE